MKIVLTLVLVAGAFAAGWYGRAFHDGQAAPAGTPYGAMTAEQRAVAEAQAHKCRDACEQLNVLQNLGDEWLRRCRLDCGVTRPWEPIHSISRAPADHGR